MLYRQPQGGFRHENAIVQEVHLKVRSVPNLTEFLKVYQLLQKNWNNVSFCIECRKCIVLIWVVKLLCVCQSIVCVCVREIKFCYFPQVRTESWNSSKKVVFSGVLVFECSAGLKYCRREGGGGSRNSRGSEHYRGSMYRPSSTLTTESN